MIIKKIKSFIPKLILSSVLVGIIAAVSELYIGHRFILDPLLYGKDLGFVYESYFAPTYYGFAKTIIVAITFFLVFLFTQKKKLNLLAKSAITGIIGTIIFGMYYYFTFPRTGFYAAALVGIVHFSFIFVASYLISKLVELNGKKDKK